MKTLLLVLAAAGLTGCAVYPAPAYDTYGAVAAPAYVVDQPVYLYGGGVYRYGGYPYAYPRSYYRVHPVAFPHHPPRPGVRGLRPGHGARDRGRDGFQTGMITGPAIRIAGRGRHDASGISLSRRPRQHGKRQRPGHQQCGNTRQHRRERLDAVG